MYHFDPYNVFLATATNIPQRLKTGFVVQGHIYSCDENLNFVSHDPSEIILICWFGAQQKCPIFNVKTLYLLTCVS